MLHHSHTLLSHYFMWLHTLSSIPNSVNLYHIVPAHCSIVSQYVNPRYLNFTACANFKFCKFVSYCTSVLYYCISVCYLLARMPLPTPLTHNPFSSLIVYHPRSTPHLSNGVFSCFLHSFTSCTRIYSHFKPTLCTSPPPILSLPQFRHGDASRMSPATHYSLATSKVQFPTSQTLLPCHSFQTTPLPATSTY